MEGSVTILSLVAKVSKKVIPPPPKKTNFADRLICETVVLKNKKKIHHCTLSVSCKNKV